MNRSLLILLVAVLAIKAVFATFDIDQLLAEHYLQDHQSEEDFYPIDVPTQDSGISADEQLKWLESLGYDHSKFFTSNGELTAPTLAQMKLAAQLSGASYCVKFNMQGLANWTCKSCPTSIQMSGTTVWKFDGFELGAYVGYDSTNKVIRLVFRGSSNFSNWMANLAFAKTSIGSGKGEVHIGFRTAYLQTRSDIIAKITALRSKYNNPPVSVTGHSLGGAVALLATLDFKSGIALTEFDNGLSHVSSGLFPEELPFSSNQLTQLGASTSLHAFPLSGPLITFGQPRVGDAQFASWALTQLASIGYFRVTHRYDPVPRIPTQAMGFFHSNPYEIYFTDKDAGAGYKICAAGSAEDKKCIIGPIMNLSIADHKWYATVNLHQDEATCANR